MNLNAGTRILLVAVAASLIAAGCKNKEQQLIGKWDAPGGSPVLTFNKDKTFSQNANNTLQTGTWRLFDNKVTVTIDKVAGMPVGDAVDLGVKMGQIKPEMASKLKEAAKASNLTLSDDGKTLTITDPFTGKVGQATKEEGQ